MFTILLLTSILAFLLANFLRKRSKLPPGPLPFPIIGNLPQIGLLSAKYGGIVGALKQLKKEYGPVFTIWLGPQPTVHICDMEIAHETMVKRGGEFTDRWVPKIFNIVRNGLGIMGTNGDYWVEQRRFTLHTFRNFGMGRGFMEERIMQEFRAKADDFDKKNGNSLVEMNPQPFFDTMVGSIINRILLNEPLNEGAEFFELKRKIDVFFRKLSLVDQLAHSDFVQKLPIFKTRLMQMTQAQAGTKEFLMRKVQERIAAIEQGDHIPSNEPEDYVDAYLLKLKEEEKVPNSSYSLESLNINLLDLWIAGQETTTTTLVAALSILLNHTKVMDKVREELLSVTGGSRELSLMDKATTPYFNATIMELQRQASILNLNLFRCTKEDTFIGGHPVAKGTAVTAQISMIMGDENSFRNTNVFDPTRFLKENKSDQSVIPFGIGKRSCLGESLARAELYLILGNMILRYHIEPSDELPVTEQLNNKGVFKRPSKYTMRIKKFE